MWHLAGTWRPPGCRLTHRNWALFRNRCLCFLLMKQSHQASESGIPARMGIQALHVECRPLFKLIILPWGNNLWAKEIYVSFPNGILTGTVICVLPFDWYSDNLCWEEMPFEFLGVSLHSLCGNPIMAEYLWACYCNRAWPVLMNANFPFGKRQAICHLIKFQVTLEALRRKSLVLRNLFDLMIWRNWSDYKFPFD